MNDNTTEEILYGGGAYGGKSWFGSFWLITNCLRYEGSRWFMGREHLTDLKKSTLLSFFDVCKTLGLKKDEHYIYNDHKNKITFINESEVYLKDLFAYPSDPEFDSLGSTEYSGAFIVFRYD